MSNDDYRFAFQGQEEDDEFWGGAVSYKYRVEDKRLGRFFSADPLEASYPHNSPYAFSENMVIHMIELEGLEATGTDNGDKKAPELNLPNYSDIMRKNIDNVFNTHQEPNWYPTNDAEGEIWEQELMDLQDKQFGRAAHLSATINGAASALVHGALDAGGMAPFIGEGFDLINAFIYYVEGDNLNAGISMAATIPFYGWIATGGKYVYKGAKYSAEIIDASKSTAGLFEMTFKSVDGSEVGVLANQTILNNGKTLQLDSFTTYGKKIDGSEMGGNDLGLKTVLEYRQAMSAWAKENGFEEIVLKNAERVANSSSAKTGKIVNATIDLTD